MVYHFTLTPLVEVHGQARVVFAAWDVSQTAGPSHTEYILQSRSRGKALPAALSFHFFSAELHDTISAKMMKVSMIFFFDGSCMSFAFCILWLRLTGSVKWYSENVTDGSLKFANSPWALLNDETGPAELCFNKSGLFQHYHLFLFRLRDSWSWISSFYGQNIHYWVCCTAH